jgi:hypothetical protein
VPDLKSFEERERRVSSIELFLDLVFVFAFTQVTTFWLEHTSWSGLGRGLLVLLVLWWVWASYAWLTNAADAEAGVVSSVLLFAVGALFVAALAVPDAFGRHRLLFALALFVVLAAFVGLYALVSKDVPDQLAAVLRMSRTVVPGGALMVVAALAPAGVRPVRRPCRRRLDPPPRLRAAPAARRARATPSRRCRRRGTRRIAGPRIRPARAHRAPRAGRHAFVTARLRAAWPAGRRPRRRR